MLLRPISLRLPPRFITKPLFRGPQLRTISSTSARNVISETERHRANSGAQQAAAELGDKGNRIEQLARAQSVSWHRDQAGNAPGYQGREMEADGKEGKLLSTPSRLLKLILPLHPPKTSGDDCDNQHTTTPLAILAHPHQPLSYLERLLRAEVPPLETTSTTRPPDIHFLAPAPSRSSSDHDEVPSTYPSSTHPDLVRYSPATELGDFLRDASKANFFLLDIEGSPKPLKVSVPSFSDRTYYLRNRLRILSREIAAQTALKDECDRLAHRGAQRVALAGFGGLVTWWAAVTYATFYTPLGWEVMEPVTYLVGLSGVISGYLWFLYHNREVSYRSVLHLTVSRRQIRLYDEKGFELEKWHELVEEGKKVRREIRSVAEEYDVEWDEGGDGGVKKVLDHAEEMEERRRKGRVMKDEDDNGVDDEEELVKAGKEEKKD